MRFIIFLIFIKFNIFKKSEKRIKSEKRNKEKEKDKDKKKEEKVEKQESGSVKSNKIPEKKTVLENSPNKFVADTTSKDRLMLEEPTSIKKEGLSPRLLSIKQFVKQTTPKHTPPKQTPPGEKEEKTQEKKSTISQSEYF
jgi:hypothetical protein